MKWIKSLATLALMGVPAWVVVVGVLRSEPSVLVVHVTEPGVEVRLGDQRLKVGNDSRTFGPVETTPGEYRLQVSSEGAVVFDRVITVGPGEPSEVWAKWGPEARGSAASRAILGLDVAAEEHTGHDARITSVGASGDDRTVLSTAADGTLRVWDATTGAALRSVKAHEGVVHGMSVMSDGARVVTVGDDLIFRIWDLASGNELKAIDSHLNAILTCTALSKDSSLMALGTEGGQTVVIDLETGREQHRWTSPRHTPGGLAFSPDGRTLLVGMVGPNRDASPIRVYNLETGELVRELRGHNSPVWGVAFLPDGRRAISGSGDRTLRLWDVTSGEELKRFEGHPGALLSVAVSRDGRYALAGTGHHWAGGWSEAEVYGAHVWDLEEGLPVGRLETPAPVRSVAFSRDGRRVLAGGEDRSVRWWSLTEAVAIARRSQPGTTTVSSKLVVPATKG